MFVETTADRPGHLAEQGGEATGGTVELIGAAEQRRHGTPPAALFVGDSPALVTLRERLGERGLRIAAAPHQDLVCVVADEDVLDGLCSPEQAALLATCHDLGLACLGPDVAAPVLREALSAHVGVPADDVE